MKKILFITILLGVVFGFLGSSLCSDGELISPKDLIVRAWVSWGGKDYEKTFYYTDKCIELYSEDASTQQSLLHGLPATEVIDQYEALNAVGTSFFIQGEVYLFQGKLDEAKKSFRKAVEDYGYSQNWDPRGWFWSVKEKSQASLDKLEGKEEEKPLEEKPKIKRQKTKITLHNPGIEEIIDYKKYGVFKNIGTTKYKYVVKDPEGLAEAAGQGIHPNTSGVRWDANYHIVKSEGRLEGKHWDFVNTDDLEANFYKWTEAPEPMGVKLFYTAVALEKSGLLRHAIKAYYAIVVHFPKTVGWTYFHTPWYIAQVAIDRIDYLLRNNPDLKMSLQGAEIFVENGFDNDIKNDTFFVDPGELREVNFFGKLRKGLLKSKTVKTGKVIKQIGDGRVDLVKYKNGHWQLRLEGRPYIVKGVAYAPNRVGQSPDEGTLDDWMQEDYNENAKIDAAYDTWVDKNYNNIQDPDEEAVGDFELLKGMGCNTIRLYHHASNK